MSESVRTRNEIPYLSLVALELVIAHEALSRYYIKTKSYL